MRFVRIRNREEEGYRRAMALYEISFPLHEQRLPDSQENILSLEAYHLELIQHGDAFLGAIFYWETEEFIYVEHFCMDPAIRGKGFGQRALALLAQQGKTVILEIDPPVDEISKRRKGFYQRCGFTENPYPHVHPAYRPEYQGHALVVLSAPSVLEADTYEAFWDYLCHTVMKSE